MLSTCYTKIKSSTENNKEYNYVLERFPKSKTVQAFSRFGPLLDEGSNLQIICFKDEILGGRVLPDSNFYEDFIFQTGPRTAIQSGVVFDNSFDLKTMDINKEIVDLLNNNFKDYKLLMFPEKFNGKFRNLSILPNTISALDWKYHKDLFEKLVGRNFSMNG